MKRIGKIKTLILLTLCLIVLGGCTVVQNIGDTLNRSTIVLYTPITYCQGVYSPTGEIVAIRVYVYRVNSIINNQDVPVTMHRGYFFVSPEDTRLPTVTSRTFATFPPSVTVGPGDTLLSPGALSLRAETASRYRVAPPDATHPGYRVSYPQLIYDPTLSGNPSGVIPVNERGIWLQTSDLTACRQSEVLSLIESTP